MSPSMSNKTRIGGGGELSSWKRWLLVVLYWVIAVAAVLTVDYLQAR